MLKLLFKFLGVETLPSARVQKYAIGTTVVFTLALGTLIASGIYHAQIDQDNSVAISLLVSLMGYAFSFLLSALYVLLVLAFFYGPLLGLYRICVAIKRGFVPTCRAAVEQMRAAGRGAASAWTFVATVPSRLRAMTGKQWFAVLALVGMYVTLAVAGFLMWNVAAVVVTYLGSWVHFDAFERWMFTLVIDVFVCIPLWFPMAFLWLYVVRVAQRHILNEHKSDE